GGRGNPATDRGVHGPKERHVALVGGTLAWRQLEPQRDHVEVGEEAAGEVADRELVDDGANELVQAGDGGRLPCGRRREAEPGAGDRHLERLVAQVAAEVVYLVDDQQLEAVAKPAHPAVGALERRQGDRTQLSPSVTEATDGARIGVGDRSFPLLEESARRDEAERRYPHPRHSGDGDPCLTAAGRQG